jgi:hypothetical protein
LWEPPVVQAQGVIVPWTSIGAGGTVDELSIPEFAFNLASAGYSPASTTIKPLEFRYNVTNTHETNPNPNMPGWTVLELGGIAPGNSSVSAVLYKVQRCTGLQKALCGTKIGASAMNTCNACQFPNTAVDFSGFVYYVDVTVSRSTLSESPMVNTLRIY